MKLITNKEAIIKCLSDIAESIDVSLGYVDIDTDLRCPENSENIIIIQGQIEAKVKHDPGNYHQGFGWEWMPHDYVSDWKFKGDIQIRDTNETIIETINYNDLFKQFKTATTCQI